MLSYQDILNSPLDKLYQQTFKNRKVNLMKMTHGHASNCYWYSIFFQNVEMLKNLEEQLKDLKHIKNEIVKKQDYEKAVLLRDEEKAYILLIEHLKTFPVNPDMNANSTLLYKRVLDERFNGEVLPYNPHPDFETEINWLMKLKMLFCTPTGYDIVRNNVKIGQVDIL